jgi:hypothetical protein
MLVQGIPTARADTLRNALDSVFAAPAYRWETREDPFGPIRRAWLLATDYLDRLRHTNPQAFRALTWLLAVVLVLILAHAAWVSIKTVRAGSRRVQRDVAGPSTVPRDAAWYARESSRLAAAGEYVAAMQADFLRLVLELDGRRVMRYHPSKTPSEYVRDAALTESGRAALRSLVREMYVHAFAHVPLDRDGYDRWRSRAVAEHYAATN